jgi:nicotinamide mononucleotide transporter
MQQLIQETLLQIRQTQPLEWIAALFGVISVLLSRKNHIGLYPAGLVSTGIYAWLWVQSEARLYAEALLNVYYFVMSVYGWIHWSRQKPGADSLRIGKANSKDWLIVGAIVGFGWMLFYILLRHTPSDVPIWDSLVSATAWSGMWLLARRKVENWIMLNISNLVAIPLYIHKGYYVTMLLTVFLFIVAILGYFNWLKLYAQQEQEAQALKAV